MESYGACLLGEKRKYKRIPENLLEVTLRPYYRCGFFCLFFKASKVKTPQILSEPSGHLVKRHLKLSNPLTPSLHAAGLIENIYCSQRGALSHTHSLLRTQRKKTQAAKSGETQRKARKKKSDYMESGFW